MHGDNLVSARADLLDYPLCDCGDCKHGHIGVARLAWHPCLLHQVLIDVIHSVVTPPADQSNARKGITNTLHVIGHRKDF